MLLDHHYWKLNRVWSVKRVPIGDLQDLQDNPRKIKSSNYLKLVKHIKEEGYI